MERRRRRAAHRGGPSERGRPADEGVSGAVRLAPRAHRSLAASRQYGELQSIEAFASGTKLMRNWPYAFSALASEPRMRDGTRLRFGVTALPGRTVLGGQNLAVSEHSPTRTTPPIWWSS